MITLSKNKLKQINPRHRVWGQSWNCVGERITFQIWDQIWDQVDVRVRIQLEESLNLIVGHRYLLG